VTGVDETWLRDRAAALADVDPPPSTFGTQSLLRRGERARRSRRLTRAAGGAVAVATVCSAALATGSVLRGTTAPAPAAPRVVTVRPDPEVLTVTCTSSGAQVDRRRVTAERDGVRLRFVDSSGRRDEYVRYESLGPGDEPYGGDYVWSVGRNRVGAPPGRMRVGCGWFGAAPTTWQVVEVADPRGWFDPTSMADAGCPTTNVGAVTFGPGDRKNGTGATPQEAGADLARRLWGTSAGSRVRVMGGYVDAGNKTVLLFRAGEDTVVASADRTGRTWRAQVAGWCLPDQGD